ncbi:MAG: nitrilase-related carbon-nitrogen hydrolase [bacterium]
MIKVAGIQMKCHADPEQNIQKALCMLQMAAEGGARMVCFQELFHSFWFPQSKDGDNFKLAEEMHGPLIMSLKHKAKELQMAIIAPIFEKENDVYYNSCVVIDQNGVILGVYRKNHLPEIPFWEETYYFSPGNLGFPIFRTQLATIGIQMCWDNFFPEGSRILALKGAQIIFCPTACASFGSMQKWERMISANAIANGVFCFRINRVGQEADQNFYGRTFCIDPDGNPLMKPSSHHDGIIMADIDLGLIDEVRKGWSFLKNRRPEIYTEVTQTAKD